VAGARQLGERTREGGRRRRRRRRRRSPSEAARRRKPSLCTARGDTKPFRIRAFFEARGIV